MYQVMILVKNQEKTAKIAQIALNHQFLHAPSELNPLDITF